MQLHGGIGFTWEHPAHLHLKRARSAAIAFGPADRHRAVLARLADLPPPPLVVYPPSHVVYPPSHADAETAARGPVASADR